MCSDFADRGGSWAAPPPGAVIALGSNEGDSLRLLRDALRAFQLRSGEPVIASSIWRTSPVHCPPGSAAFFNAVALMVPRPDETPESLLDFLQQMEKEAGRRPKQVMNESRPLDLDLIAFGPQRRHDARLTLPHPRAHLRRFVLAPLAEIGPDWVMPGWNRTVAEWLAGLPAGERVDRIL